MSNAAYERLSTLDTTFLLLEDANVSMHIALTFLFDAGPLRTAEGGVDFEKIERWIEAALPEVPRYRQKLAWIPFQDHPVWVDDAGFNLHYHVRHTSLPRPGAIRQLKRLAARIIEQQLDRKKPLWEIWVVEGIEQDRFALILKTHHCMMDGVSGVDLVNIIFSGDPHATEIAAPRRFVPRPAPSGRTLLAREMRRGAGLPLRLAKGLPEVARGALESAREPGQLRGLLGGVLRTLRAPPPTVLNERIGPHRRFDWMSTDLGVVKGMRRALGGSVNDVVLTVIGGALRRFFLGRGLAVADRFFRVMAPVSLRSAADDGTMGNRISAWMIDLPLGQPDPLELFAAIVAQTTELKRSSQATASDRLIQLTEWLPGPLLAAGVRLAAPLLPLNLVVTNVPGPPTPWYLAGATLRDIYASVPLAANQGLGVAVGSYTDKLFWGFTADWEILPELHDFVEHTRESLEELREASARLAAAPPRGAPLAGPAPAGASSRRRPARGRGKSRASLPAPGA